MAEGHRLPDGGATLAGDAALLLARAGLAALFLIEAGVKLSAWGATQAYMRKFGVPAELLPAVLALELGGGLAALAGWKTCYAALALAAFSVAAALLFHNRLADPAQALHFLKDVAIAGGFLALAVAGSGRWSIDRLVASRRAV